MARDVEHVVNSTEQPVVALVVALGAVAGEVAARKTAPVLRLVALWVAPDGASHSRPRPLQHQIATLAERQAVALFVEDVGLDAREGEGRGARLEHRDARQRRDQDLARLGHPPGIDHWAAIE